MPPQPCPGGFWGAKREPWGRRRGEVTPPSSAGPSFIINLLLCFCFGSCGAGRGRERVGFYSGRGDIVSSSR